MGSSSHNRGLTAAQIKWAFAEQRPLYPVKKICIVCKKAEQVTNKRCKDCQ